MGWLLERCGWCAQVMRASYHRRLSLWVHSRFVPAVLVLVLVADVLAGLNWWLAPDSALTSPAYAVAKMVAPMDAHGITLLVLVAVGAGSWLALGRRWLSGFLAGQLLASFWAGWVVLFGLAPIGRPGASFLGAIFAALMLVLHVLVGLAVARDDEG